MDKDDRDKYWSVRLEHALGPLESGRAAAGVRAAVAAEHAGCAEEDVLWEGKKAATNWEPAADPEPSVEWRAVRVVPPIQADVLKVALETAGIPVVLQGEPGWISGLAVSPKDWEVSIFVPRDRVVEAEALIDHE